MYPRYHMYELARQVRQAQHMGPARQQGHDNPGASDEETGAVWRMGMLLAVIALVVGGIAWLAN